MFIAALFTMAKKKQFKYPSMVNGQRKYDIHIYCSTLKRKKILPYRTTWINIENIILYKIRQS